MKQLRHKHYYGMLFYYYLQISNTEIVIDENYTFEKLTASNLRTAFDSFEVNNSNHRLGTIFNGLIGEKGFFDYRFSKVHYYINGKTKEEIKDLLNKYYYQQFQNENKFEDELLLQLVNNYVPNVKSILAVNSNSIRLFNKFNNFQDIKFSVQEEDILSNYIKIFNYLNDNKITVDILNNNQSDKLYDVIIYEPEFNISNKAIITDINKLLNMTNKDGIVISKTNILIHCEKEDVAFMNNLLGVINLPNDDLSGYIRMPYKTMHINKRRRLNHYFVHGDTTKNNKFLIDLTNRQTRRHHFNEDDDLYKPFANFVINVINNNQDRDNLIKFIDEFDVQKGLIFNNYINYTNNNIRKEGLFKLDQSNTFNFENIEKINNEVIDLLIKISKSSRKNFSITRSLILD